MTFKSKYCEDAALHI